MKINNIQIYIIILILISFISCKENKQLQNVEEGISPLQGNNNVIINTWRYGFALDKEGKPVYYDPGVNAESSFVISYFIKTDNEIKKVESDIIYGEKIQFFEDVIYVSDVNKNKRGISIGEDLELKHMIKNQRNYVSKDGKNWEVLEIKYFKETNEKMVYTQTNIKNDVYTEPLILVYFKCSYFEGEYYITSRL